MEDENVWLMQKLIAKLFDVKIPTINEHLKNAFEAEELKEKSVIRNFLITAKDGKIIKQSIIIWRGLFLLGSG